MNFVNIFMLLIHKVYNISDIRKKWMRRIIPLILVALIVMSFSNAVHGDKSEVISEQGTISQNPYTASYKGDVYAVWEEDAEEKGTDIVFRTSSNGWRVRSIISPGKKSENTEPILSAYRDELYSIWVTTNSNISEGRDRDIVIRSYGDKSWGEHSDVSSYSPKEDDEDSSPKAIVYDDKMNIFWDNGTHIYERTYDGNLSDKVNIVAPSTGIYDVETYDGKLFLSYTYRDTDTNELKAVVKYKDENDWLNYSVEYNPQSEARNYAPDLEVYKDKLYIAWVTTDKTISSGEYDDDVVIRSYDAHQGSLTEASAWSSITELSGFEMDHQDIWPVMEVYGGRLYVLWQTWNIQTHVGDLGDDIAMRSFDGDSWSSLEGVTDDEKHDGGIYGPGIGVTSDADGLYLIWQSKENKKYGDDWKINFMTYGEDDSSSQDAEGPPLFYILAAMTVMILIALAVVKIRAKKG